MTLRVGIVGCGRVARTHHGPILARMPKVRVTALIDHDAKARRELGKLNQGAVYFSDVETAIGLGLIDALVICTSPEFHASTAIAGLEAGLHVYIEKPLALDLDEADRVAAAAEASGRVAMVGHNFRFHPGVEALKRRFAGSNQDIVAIQTLFTSERRALPGWKTEPAKGGDAITDLGIHHLDMVAYLSGADVDVDSVTARVLTSDNGSAATIAGKLTTGQPLSITVSQISGQNAHKILILSADGHFELDLLSRDALRHDRPSHRLSLAERIEDRGRRLVAAADIRGSRDPSFERALRHFVSLASGSEPASENRLPVSGGRKALALALAARASAEAANH